MPTFNSIRDYIAELRKRKALLQANRRKECERIVLDAKALVQLRIQTSSENASGSQFEDYNPIYAVHGRKEKGYQAERFDFTRTGVAWRSILPVTVEESNNTIHVDLLPRDQKNRDKLNGQFRKRGNILLLSAEEIRILQEANRERILKYLNNG